MPQYFSSVQLSDKISKTPEGFLICEDVPITKVGELLYMPNEVPDVEAGNAPIITVERTNEDVFDPETIASFEGKPLTLLHPKEFVNPDNWKKVAVGAVQNVRAGVGDLAGKLVSDIVVYDKDAVRAIERKEMREVSCGYEAEYIDLGSGRARQTRIRGNHLALVPRGRAGPECAIFDSAPKEKPMSWKAQLKAALAGVSKAVDSAPEEGEEETMDSMKAKMADMKKKYDEAMEKLAGFEKSQDEIAALKKDADAAKATSDALRAEIAALKAAPTKVTHDAETVSAAEVLSPGIAKDLPDLKVAALKAAAATEDGKAAFKKLFGDAAPDFTNPAVVDVTFRAVAAQVADARNRKNNGTPPQPTADALKKREEAITNFHDNFAEAAAKLHPVPRF